MQDHNIPLLLLIISVYILTVLFLWNMFSNGHVTVTSCLFLHYEPSTNPEKGGKSAYMHSAECMFFALFTFQNGNLWLRLWRRFWKVRFVSISYLISCSNSFKQLQGQISCHCILIFVHCQVQSLCWPLCGQVICVSNLRTMCLRCILSPTSFQFFKKFPEAVMKSVRVGRRRGRWR